MNFTKSTQIISTDYTGSIHTLTEYIRNKSNGIKGKSISTNWWLILRKLALF